MEPVTVAALVGGASTLIGTVGAWLHGNNKANKLTAAHQEERSRLQKQIEDLLKKITEKDLIIKKLQERISELNKEKLVETQRRHQLCEMIDELEKRQQKLESILTGLLAFITFRFGKWNQDKILLRQTLLASQNDRDTIETLLLAIESKQKEVEQKFIFESSQLDELHNTRVRLTEEFEKIGA